MPAPSHCARQAMTLVELLVVLAILGLLGVAVSPLIQSRDDQQTFRNAADTLSLHFADAASRSIGETSESGIWLEGSQSNSAVVVDLAFARTTVTEPATIQIASINSSDEPPTATLANPLPSSPAAGSPVRFLESTSLYRVKTDSQIEMLPNHNLNNDAFPPTGVQLVYQMTQPPKRKNSFRARRLAGDACIDLGWSSVGIDLDGLESGVQAANNYAALQEYSKAALLFDSLGRPSTAWLYKSSDNKWMRLTLGNADPLVLLIGSATQVGATIVADPTEDNPGANIQNPYAVWLILDPKTGATSIVENNAANNPFDAQKFVRQKLGLE
jgi:prepilin-type N-terminal cleavage/methylation domain-containing protein